MATDTNVSESVRLAAIRDALSRAGVSEKATVEVTVTPFDQLFEDVVTGGSRADYRRSIGHPDPEPQSPAIDDTNRPGGQVRVLSSHPDGRVFVIDGDTTDQADDDQDDTTGTGWDRVPDEGHEPGRQRLTNQPLALPPAGGYLPTETALEVAAEANRNHRAQLRRR
jgi:hypothetical protein